MAEAAKKGKSKIVGKFVTPKGGFKYAWLSKPDNSEYGKGKYKCAILLEQGVKENDDFAKKLNDLHKAAKGKTDARPAKDGSALADAAMEEGNDKKESLRGFWVITAKSKQKPEQKAADGKTDLRETAKSGDYGRMSIAASEYDTGSNKGVTLYLNGIKLLERRAQSNLGFDDETGEYENDDAEPSMDEDESEGAGTSGSNDDQDF
ncbi:DUF2815 family protein [Caballeronia sp. LZ033]|uniref:ssDNA-binding protein n=1 Tax=Caballeronia sp. LZ033 TaxID=3038566 RepID=UPI00286007D6|nr:ssDNA-binding protein [Caballeronia sp. LZ033]MDR5811987.1 DUF2815 family protein [Caballeronia sp. LZ033]